MTPIPIVTRLLLGLSLAATIVLGSPNTASAHIGEGPEAGRKLTADSCSNLNWAQRWLMPAAGPVDEAFNLCSGLAPDDSVCSHLRRGHCAGLCRSPSASAVSSASSIIARSEQVLGSNSSCVGRATVSGPFLANLGRPTSLTESSMLHETRRSPVRLIASTFAAICALMFSALSPAHADIDAGTGTITGTISSSSLGTDLQDVAIGLYTYDEVSGEFDKSGRMATPTPLPRTKILNQSGDSTSTTSSQADSNWVTR